MEQDRQDFAQEQDSMKVKQIEFNHLKKQCTKSVVAKATDKARGGTARRAPQFQTRFPARLPDFNHVPQVRLKTFAPPGSLVWMGRTDGAWHGRYKNMAEKSCRDTAWGGESYAALAVLRHCWHWWCLLEGYERSAVPIKDLWGDGAAGLVPLLST